MTDANLWLGRIGTRQPLGGTIRLDPGRAREAIAAVGARVPGLDLDRLADGIVRIAVARMTASIREVTIQRGHDPRDFTLVAFGGAGPMHAIPVAEELGIGRILVPPHPGNVSALGLLASDLKHDFVRTRIGPLADVAALRDGFAAMRSEAEAQLAREGFAAGAIRLVHALDLRYLGQAFELGVPVEPAAMTAGGVAAEFHRRHLETYGHADEAGAVEVVNLRLTAYGLVPKAPLPRPPSPTRALAEAEAERRPVSFEGERVSCPVYRRERLPAATPIGGPAIVEEFGATAVIFPGWRAAADEIGILWLERSRP